jgi:xanthine dehydrogenase YagR molybdenum-binding subunit
MPAWPEKRNIIGTNVPRLDGATKVSGKAKYSFDKNLPGLLHAKILRSPHAHAKVVKLDLEPATKMNGVLAVEVIKGEDRELFYAGDEIAAVAAESEEIARDAVRAIRVEYEVLPHIASEEDGMKAGAAKPPTENQKGDVEKALEGAAFKIEGFYGAAVQTHVCLETHGLVAHWETPNRLVVYASTQAVHVTAGGLRGQFADVANLEVVCRTPYMGGGFGSKFGPDVQGIVAAKLARTAGRPVKLMLERDEEHVAGGNRPSAYAKVKAGVDQNGKLVAFDAESYGTGGHSRGAGFPLPYIYEPENHRRRHTDVPVNAGEARAMRAPGHPQGCLVMEGVLDDLAEAMGKDPVEFRVDNLPTHSGTFRTLKPIYERQLRLGAERIGWKENYHRRGDKSKGLLKRGLGCALGTWSGRAGDAQATCTIHGDGRVEVKCGSQDLGTGTTTLVPLVAAEILGLKVGDVQGFIGSSEYPPAGGSGGSTSCGGVSVAVAVACTKALELLFEKVAPHLNVQVSDLEASGGRVQAKGQAAKGLSWKQACALVGAQTLQASADKNEAQNMYSQGVGGAQFAAVTVDVETGIVTVDKVVAVADCGLVMNRLLCESQVYGGVIGGINYALFEDRRLDRATARQVNPDMEFYRLLRHSELPEIEVHLLDYPERGVIGIGEPPTIPTAAAIANAVANAIGVGAPTLPLTANKVLAALKSQAEKGGR